MKKSHNYPYRFHVKKPDGGRTTVSMDIYLAAFLAIKLGEDIKTLEGHAAVRDWVQKKYDPRKPSSMISQQAIFEICDKEILKRWAGV